MLSPHAALPILDGAVPQQFQEVRTGGRAMGELRKAAKDGGLGRYFGTAADLRTKMTVAEARARRLRDQVSTFTVVPEYTEMEKEASRITREISTLNDDNTADRELILQLQRSEEHTSELQSLMRISYAVFCLKKKKKYKTIKTNTHIKS